MSNYPLDEDYDEVYIKHFKTSPENDLYYALMLKKVEGEEAVLGIYTFGVGEFLGNFRILHQFERSKKINFLIKN